MKIIPMRTVSLDSIELLDNIPDKVLNHVGMISKHERQLLYTLAKNYYKSEGIIIDGGAFLGASTAALAYGLKDNWIIFFKKKKYKWIYSYERAIVSDYFLKHAEKAGITSPEIGNSYEPILYDLISKFKKYVKMHIGDIDKYQGEDIDKIEICFLDILKEPDMSQHCINLFLPRIIPDGYLIQQDYFFDDLPWIKVLTESLVPSHLEYLGEVRSSAVFKIRKKIRTHDIENYSNMDKNRQIILHQKAEQRTLDPARQYLMQLSKVKLLIDHCNKDEALSVWEAADKTYSEYVFDDDNSYKDNIQFRIDRLNKYILKK
jgi:hypothetical protein